MQPLRRNTTTYHFSFGSLSVFAAACICCLSMIGISPAAGAGPSSAQDGPATVAAANPADPYAVEPAPLTVTQCGQCHTSVFRELKNDGRRHKFDCQNCHKQFHAYNPDKDNWQEIMPKCGQCHSQPHGASLTGCSNCHDNPHAISKLPVSETLTASCSTCHAKPAEQLKQHPSAHSKLACKTCHTSHGAVPGCNQCHRPHFEAQDFKSCSAACHPVHMPAGAMAFQKDSDARTCASCHQKVFNKLVKTQSRHASVTCTQCHGKHRTVPDCLECHTAPHSKQVHQKYPRCLTCHQDVHDLPVR